MQIVLIIIAIVLFIGALGFLALSYFGFCAFFKREKKEKDVGNEFDNLPESLKNTYRPYYEHIRAETEWFLNRPYEVCNIENDSLSLNGYYLSQKSDKTVVIMHGQKQNGFREVGEVRLYYDMGFNVFLPDIRSHGKSQGKYLGMGSLSDQKDLLKWLEFLQKNEEKPCKFLIVGFSMGGAISLTLSGNPDLPSSVAAIISHSSYTSLNELAQTAIKMNPAILKSLFIFGLRMWFRFFVKCGLNEYSPEKGVQKSLTPTLMIHGKKDNLIPLHLFEKLFALCDSEKAYWVDENAGHDMVGWANREIYESHIKAFISKYV